MLAWIAVIMIGVFLTVCGIIITASLYQILQTIRRIPRKPNMQYSIVSNETGSL
ncbi:hypothetical protein [Desulfitobacterium sp. AusDCA]|uniref:hypothetical protein n=1 Tax=Desulfitobacterium sp. AusDCA TaxID=3240383 RepID=UPI003DA6FC7E